MGVLLGAIMAFAVVSGVRVESSPADPVNGASAGSAAGVDGRDPSGLPPLAAEGQRWWTRSPDPDNPVACGTCHHDLAVVQPWAASFPKWKPLPPPAARVMTLLQANAEAVARHYRVTDPRPAATAITAYLTWLAEGRVVTPGVSAGQPVFTSRLRRLAESTARGRARYATRCAGCHDVARLTVAIGRFPRFVQGRGESLEGFVERHRPRGEPLLWDDAAMADLVAYLVSRIAARPLTGGQSSSASEAARQPGDAQAPRSTLMRKSRQ